LIRFHVALWLLWPAPWPPYIGTVEAENAYSAVVSLMQVYGLTAIARGAANSRDGSLKYRCIGVSGVSRGLIYISGPRSQ
jgi:hypothetical protein